ncbi:MAG: hypothetical protein ABIR79_22510 [Candidatus Binatia bacterium]
MRAWQYLIVIPTVVLMAASCGPHRPMGHHGEGWQGHGHGMTSGGCGPESCTYRSRCFSNGAVNSNGGVCQACSGGKWVEASGCSEPCGGEHCQKCDHGGKKGKKSEPCHHGGGHSHPHQR